MLRLSKHSGPFSTACKDLIRVMIVKNVTEESSMISNLLPFVLRLSKDERRVFQQNQISRLTPNTKEATTAAILFSYM
jgi:hypothetical protein